ncbi:MAG: DUF3570 domain-containing protein [Nitrosomonadales bacterium]|nr:DUF3570 domain-containing protein [Nitrosomonadales bacterium]
MQLTQKKKRRRKGGGVCSLLSAASASLLLAAPLANAEDVHQHHAEGAPEQLWRIDVGTMRYSEKDRISVAEQNFRARRQLGEENALTVRADYDSVSGASPTGTTKIQTTSGASGTAYMARFQTTRAAVGVDWETSLSPDTHLTLAGDHSSSKMNKSSGIGATVARDFNQRNTTLIAGASYSVDTIDMEIKTELTPDSTAAVRAASEKKDQIDLQLGVSQVLARGTLLQLNFVHGHASGYMTNPHKLLSIVHPLTGETLTYSPLTEKRPDTRYSNALYAQINQVLGTGILYGGYRYFQDTWGIKAHTVDLKYRQPFTEKLYVQPHIRVYTQGAADFYRSMLAAGETPAYASADHRLAKLQTNSVGVKLGYKPTFGGELTARIEAIRQNGELHPQDAIGVQKAADLFPELEATIFHIGYTKPF